ncbi:MULTISPECIES: helix-turn-helix domain-containing protein [unclassified Paraburkholderia]|uniref:TetR/AcrR family transcriptional regulator n=1 Tax=unclassified Paraburkholderia TaxID=2615204 RepID=UPI002AB0BFF9|nr:MULTISPECIES: helix-turn-helix domain-containing protein [unclassified Paraburkholderia]
MLDAAECVIYERGFAAGTLDEIARRAGVTRGALYGHFRGKLAMLDALFADAAHPLDPFAVNLLACQDRPFEQFIEEIELDAEPIFSRFIEAIRHSELSIEEGLHRAICDGSHDSVGFERAVAPPGDECRRNKSIRCRGESNCAALMK